VIVSLLLVLAQVSASQDPLTLHPATPHVLIDVPEVAALMDAYPSAPAMQLAADSAAREAFSKLESNLELDMAGSLASALELLGLDAGGVGDIDILSLARKAQRVTLSYATHERTLGELTHELAQMREATRRFADRLPSADVALIYFAGHGIESNRKNFLIPVNADLKFEYELAEQAYDAGVWLDMLDSIKSNNADRVNIVILDACRNNNLIGSRSIGRGLGKMDAPTGTFLAYSTAPGKVAADGAKGDRNSPFTKHLLRAMQQPNLPIEEVFKEVRRNVGRDTSGAQVPWESTSLTGFFTFRQVR